MRDFVIKMKNENPRLKKEGFKFKEEIIKFPGIGDRLGGTKLKSKLVY